MYYSSPLHKGTLINYEDMRILKYRGETKSGPFVLICGRNRGAPPPAPLLLKSIFCRLIWSGGGEMAGWKEGEVGVRGRGWGGFSEV